MKAHDPRIPEEQLHAYVDGRLDAAQRQAVERVLEQSPELRATVDAWTTQRVALLGLHGELLDEDVPPFLDQAAHQFNGAQRQWRRRWQHMAMAASVLVAFTAGWLGHGVWRGSEAAPVMQFARQAAMAHAVYAPEVRHPVEVPAAQQEHLVQWLSRRLGKPLKVPALHSQGFDLVGGRLLPGSDGARAQFMFQDARGERLTLYIGAVGKPAETTFRFAQEGNVSSFYWIDRGMGYALSGPLPRADMLELAHNIYGQLNPR
jgi:anti-sigma factor RsiW